MIWMIILLFMAVLVAWILLSPLQCKIDTREPVIMIGWKTIGRAALVYENEEWWLDVRALFFKKKWSLLQVIFKEKRKVKKVKEEQQKKVVKQKRKKMSFFQMLSVLGTFRVDELYIGISDDDFTRTAQLYWLNYMPVLNGHFDINFAGENYFIAIVSNRPWRIAYAFLK